MQERSNDEGYKMLQKRLPGISTPDSMISFTKRLLRDIWLTSQNVSADGYYAGLSIRLGRGESILPRSIPFFSVERGSNAAAVCSI
jgi:hypothetical protein